MTEDLAALKTMVDTWRANKKYRAEPLPRSILELIRKLSQSHSQAEIWRETRLAGTCIKRAVAQGDRSRLVDPTQKKKSERRRDGKKAPISFSEVAMVVDHQEAKAGACTVTLANSIGQTVKIENYVGVDALVRIFLAGGEPCSK